MGDTNHAKTELLDLTTWKWKVAGRLPSVKSVYHAGTLFYDGAFYLFGGKTKTTSKPVGFSTNKIMKFDTKTMVWSHFGKLKNPRDGHSVVLSTEKAYIVGGGKKIESCSLKTTICEEVKFVGTKIQSSARPILHAFNQETSKLIDERVVVFYKSDKVGEEKPIAIRSAAGATLSLNQFESYSSLGNGFEVKGSCGLMFEGRYYIYGGDRQRQREFCKAQLNVHSKKACNDVLKTARVLMVDDCSLKAKKQNLQFSFEFGSCTVGRGKIYLCFDEATENNKKCYVSQNPTHEFKKLNDSQTLKQESLQEHRKIRIAANERELNFISLKLLTLRRHNCVW